MRLFRITSIPALGAVFLSTVGLMVRAEIELPPGASATELSLESEFSVTAPFEIPANANYVVIYGKHAYSPVEFNARRDQLFAQAGGPLKVCAAFVSPGTSGPGVRFSPGDTVLTLRDSSSDFPRYAGQKEIWGTQQVWKNEPCFVSYTEMDNDPHSYSYCRQITRQRASTQRVQVSEAAVVGHEDQFDVMSSDLQQLAPKGAELLKFVLGINDRNVVIRCGLLLRQIDQMPAPEEQLISMLELRDVLSPFMKVTEAWPLDVPGHKPVDPRLLTAFNASKKVPPKSE